MISHRRDTASSSAGSAAASRGAVGRHPEVSQKRQTRILGFAGSTPHELQRSAMPRPYGGESGDATSATEPGTDP